MRSATTLFRKAKVQSRRRLQVVEPALTSCDVALVISCQGVHAHARRCRKAGDGIYRAITRQRKGTSLSVLVLPFTLVQQSGATQDRPARDTEDANSEAPNTTPPFREEDVVDATSTKARLISLVPGRQPC